MGVQWFPGHMAKTRRLIGEQLKICDAVFELLDARIPASSRNPLIDEILGPKPRIIIFNKVDLADPDRTGKWEQVFSDEGFPVVRVDSIRGTGVRAVSGAVRKAVAPKRVRGQKRAYRVMVVGIPNVGKSSFINRLAGRRAARTSRKPGKTRGKQWIRCGRNIELLDTPGVLWPKFQDREVGYRLAATGAVKAETTDVVEVAWWLVQWLLKNGPAALKKRFDLCDLPRQSHDVLQQIGVKRGLLLPGGRVDHTQTAITLLKEFQDGRLGRFTLDKP